MPSDPDFQDPALTAKLESSFETTGVPVSKPVSRVDETSAGSSPALHALKGDDRRPQIPDVLLEKLLGQGGMGAVFRGRQITLDRSVAVKVIHTNLALDASFVKRFEREAKVLAKLSHPNIVACYQAGRATTGEHYLLMEFVEGQDLRQRVEGEGPLGEAEALELVRQLSEALAHALEAGIIHRDVKPENILLKAAGKSSPPQAKLVDLGLASLARPGSEAVRITEAGTAVGTPVTMAPEQAEEPDSIDHRADIYALGCTLYYALTAHFPHEGGTVPQVIAKKLRGETPSPKVHRENLSAPVVDLILRMVALRVGDRPATYDDLLDLVEAAAATLPQVPSKATKGTRRLAPTALEPVHKPPAGRGWIAFGVLGAVAAVGLGAVAALRGRTPPEPSPRPTTVTPVVTPVAASPSPSATGKPEATPTEPPARSWETRGKFFDSKGLTSLDGWTPFPDNKSWIAHDNDNGDFHADVDARMTAKVEFTRLMLDEPPPAEWAIKGTLFPQNAGLAGVWIETEGGAFRFAVGRYSKNIDIKLDAVDKDGTHPRPQDSFSVPTTLGQYEGIQFLIEFADDTLWARWIKHEGKGREGATKTWVTARVGTKATRIGLFATNIGSGLAACAFDDVELSDRR